MLLVSSGTREARSTVRTMPVPEQVGHAPAELNDSCSAEKHAGRGTLFVMVLLQLRYLIHIFDRNGGDAIVFHGYRQRT